MFTPKGHTRVTLVRIFLLRGQEMADAKKERPAERSGAERAMAWEL
jgi:hypothetical protein